MPIPTETSFVTSAGTVVATEIDWLHRELYVSLKPYTANAEESTLLRNVLSLIDRQKAGELAEIIKNYRQTVGDV